jgi:hypothetical protein
MVFDRGMKEVDYEPWACLFHSYKAGLEQCRLLDRKFEGVAVREEGVRISKTLCAGMPCQIPYCSVDRTLYRATALSLSEIFLEAAPLRICCGKRRPSDDRPSHHSPGFGKHGSETRGYHSLPCSVKR